MVWNLLCDQAVDPYRLNDQLRICGARLVLSLQALDELVNTYLRANDDNLRRGMQLFSHVQKHLASGVLCSREPHHFLASEMWELNGSFTESSRFMGIADREKIVSLVAKLACGQIDQALLDGAINRKLLAAKDRSDQRNQLKQNPRMKAELSGICEGNLKQWMSEFVCSSEAIRMLAKKLLAQFPDAPKTELWEYAARLLRDPRCLIAGGMIRADLYYAWRCANRESARKDLLDDMFHVLNAIYCDCYATKEARQKEYASILLSPTTRVEIFDNTLPINEWIIKLSMNQREAA